MKDIAIYGAGGLGREVACLINNKINENHPTWNIIGFFDDALPKGSLVSHFGSVLGGIDDVNKIDRELAVVIAIGNPALIALIVEKINNPNILYPNIIHPDFKIVDSFTFCVGKGNIIQGGCVVSCDVTLGNFNILNGSVVFGHDDKIGDYNCFMPAVRVSGEVTIGCHNFFGVGAIVLQQLKIGEHVRLGAGSVLMTNPKDGKLYIGNPAKKFEL